MPVHDYAPPVDILFGLGSPSDFEEANREWRNYVALGFGPEDIPELIRLVGDERLRSEEAAENEFYAHIHAWRVLGQLHAAEAAEPLTRLFATAEVNDWVIEDLPIAFGLVGPAAIPALKTYMTQNASQEAASPDLVLLALKHIADQHPESRDECVTVMVEQLTKYNENIVTLNSFIIGKLIDLEAVEAAPLIKAAHAARRVDIRVNGTWEDVTEELGIDPSEIPGPEPVEESLRPMSFPFFDSPFGQLGRYTDVREELDVDPLAEPMPQAPAPKNRRKSQAQRKAKRKQENKSRKRNRKR